MGSTAGKDMFSNTQTSIGTSKTAVDNKTGPHQHTMPQHDNSARVGQDNGYTLHYSEM